MVRQAPLSGGFDQSQGQLLSAWRLSGYRLGGGLRRVHAGVRWRWLQQPAGSEATYGEEQKLARFILAYGVHRLRIPSRIPGMLFPQAVVLPRSG